jgi:ATP-dependent HslUV protease ATP-binding subunit HslU
MKKYEMNLTPKEIVLELDRFIIGQNQAKKAVALALRNRWRRKNVIGQIKEEIVPKNILMVGSTGVGKTEIARRLAKLAGAPFIKVEATKFTEVGYVGRDVDSIIRDLLDNAILMIKEQNHKIVEAQAREQAEEKILDALVGDASSEETREKFRRLLKEGKLEDKEIEIEIVDNGQNNMPSFDIPGMPGGAMGVINISDMLSKALGGERTKKKKVLVSQAKELLCKDESNKLIDEEKIIKEAIDLVQNEGIVFLDEIDKIATRNDARGGEVSREGVQRDLLPLIEGTVVSTKYGSVKTDYILFIASGAFHLAKPSDLLPELQGRLPIRVELTSLTKEDLVRVLKEPESSLIKQYIALMATEGVHLEFEDSAIEEIASMASEINRDIENIGARRLHTILEKLLEDISFLAPEKQGKFIVDDNYVKAQLSELIKQSDLSKFIL